MSSALRRRPRRKTVSLSRTSVSACRATMYGRANANAHSHGETVVADVLETLRVEHGIPRWGAELTANTLPPEAGPHMLAAISYTKGCYVGQETIARLKSVGHVNRTLVFLHSGVGGFSRARHETEAGRQRSRRRDQQRFFAPAGEGNCSRLRATAVRRAGRRIAGRWIKLDRGLAFVREDNSIMRLRIGLLITVFALLGCDHHKTVSATDSSGAATGQTDSTYTGLPPVAPSTAKTTTYPRAVAVSLPSSSPSPSSPPATPPPAQPTSVAAESSQASSPLPAPSPAAPPAPAPPPNAVADATPPLLLPHQRLRPIQIPT